MTASDHPRALRGSAENGRVFRDYESWQRSDLGEYYDSRTLLPEDVTASAASANHADRVPSGGVGRTITALGTIVALTGGAGWLWLILAFVSSMGGGTIAEHPFDTRVAGIALGSGGLLAIVIGSLVAVAGTWLSRAARSRYERAKWNPGRSS
jgi:hypothetical protein